MYKLLFQVHKWVEFSRDCQLTLVITNYFMCQCWISNSGPNGEWQDSQPMSQPDSVFKESFLMHFYVQNLLYILDSFSTFLSYCLAYWKHPTFFKSLKSGGFFSAKCSVSHAVCREKKRNQVFILSGILPVLAPGEAVAELRVGKLVQAPRSCHTEVTPDILVTAEVQLLHCTRTWFETLWE